MAAPPVFRTWVAGEVVTAAYFNANVRDAGNFFLSWPVVEVRQTVAQALTNAAFTGLTFDIEEVDTDGWHSTVTNTSRITPQTAGRVQVGGGASAVANATGRRVAAWYANGAEANASRTETGPPTAASTWVVALRLRTFAVNGTTDFLELDVFQNAGGPLNTSISPNGEQASLSARLVGTT